MLLNNSLQTHHPIFILNTEKRVNSDDFPHPESPIITILNKLSLFIKYILVLLHSKIFQVDITYKLKKKSI